VEKVCKVEKVRSTFHTFHDYLNFCREKKDDGLLTIYECMYSRPFRQREIVSGKGTWNTSMPELSGDVPSL